MIGSVYLISRGKRIEADIAHESVVEFDLHVSDATAAGSIEINFTQPIKKIRTHDYSWAAADRDLVSTAYSPKIIMLENGQLVQADRHEGVWEFDKSKPNRLVWHFNIADANPLGRYNSLHEKETEPASVEIHCKPKLLFVSSALEFSRSPKPFAAIACFTDHCDFDTAESLELQRRFFKKHGIKVTKGFFLNQFSKRSGNVSWENAAEELRKWTIDGHELAYHSLSQAIKNLDESLADFNAAVAPEGEIPTWIDHGYQPYNLSLYAANRISDESYAALLEQKKLANFWNHIDSGMAGNGVVNQLNPGHFTLSGFVKSCASIGLKKRVGLLMRTIIVYYYADKKLIRAYECTAINAKKVMYNKNLKALLPAASNALLLLKPLLSVLLNWKKHKNTPFRLAKFAPLVFRHKIAGREFNIFQTIEMVDFKASLSPENIDLLINEHGVFVAHTYFSAPMSYHSGRMFKNPTEVDPVVEANFRQLGEKIADGKIWNPTLNELIAFLNQFAKIRMDAGTSGEAVVIGHCPVPNRIVN